MWFHLNLLVAAAQIPSTDADLIGTCIKVHNIAVTKSSCNTDILEWSFAHNFTNVHPKFNPRGFILQGVLVDVSFVMYPGHIQKVLRRMGTFGQCEDVLRIFGYVRGICDAFLAECTAVPADYSVTLIVNSDKMLTSDTASNIACLVTPK